MALQGIWAAIKGEVLRVNVICKTRNNAAILYRLARMLCEHTGWSLNDGPHPDADLNYWICYIEHAEMFSDWRQTKVAAWYTHKDPESQEWKDSILKRFWWELSAGVVDLRMTSARQYADDLSGYGPTALVRPPVDRLHFNIRETVTHDVPRVGVSGYVHPGPRKGARLVARLAGSDLGRRIEVVGSGQGWPVPTQEREWSDLPDWYNSLDVLLCSSLTEGIPMPPLEALACGIPVVIPTGVGLLDDLPDVTGIYRYQRGDYDTMRAAVERALAAGGVDRQALRAATDAYTAEAWAADHVQAFESFLSTADATHTESDRHGKRGVYYVAYGEPARHCARAAIASFQKHMPGVPVALASDRALGGEDTLVSIPDIDIGGRAAKTMIYDAVPDDWQYVMYLDADTEVIAPINFFFELLDDGWDMVICKNPAKYHTAAMMVRSDNHDECNYTFHEIGTDQVIQLNGGVFAFQRNERTASFFRCWHEEWQRYGKRDQAALLRALWKHPLKMYVLGNEWNTIIRDGYKPGREGSAGILHYPMTARRWRGKVVQRSDSPEAWRRVKEFERSKGG